MANVIETVVNTALTSDKVKAVTAVFAATIFVVSTNKVTLFGVISFIKIRGQINAPFINIKLLVCL